MEYFLAIVGRFFIKNVLDLSPGPGTFAIAASKLRLGYWCLCMSSEHASQLRKMAQDTTLRMMLDPNSGIYNVKVAKLMKTVCGEKEATQKLESVPAKTKT